MDWKTLHQFWVPMALLCGFSTAGHLGKEFITVFMENNQPASSTINLQVIIAGYTPSTNVKVFVNATNYQKSFIVNDRFTIGVDVPISTELLGSKRSNNVVVIQSDKDVSVMSLNYKQQSTDTSVLYPVDEWGTEYYVVTPTTSASKQFAVISGKEQTSLDIYFTSPVKTEDGLIKAGVKSTWVLKPYTAYQFLSDGDLSGTRVVSQKPVAVLSGFTCGSKTVGCSHVYEQLQPVPDWGTSFIIPPIISQSLVTDIVYVVASQPTKVNYQIGTSANSRTLAKGEVMKLDLPPLTAILITSGFGVQVMYFCTGGTYGLGIKFTPFLTTIYPVTSYCTSYYIYGQEQFDNYGVLVSKTSDAPNLTYNNKLVVLSWKNIPGTEYSWASQNLGSGLSFQTLANPSSPFLLLSYGLANRNSFGSPAICIGGPSCSTAKCRPKEKCQILYGKAVCVPESQSYCHAVGDPHYRTFDGRTYDFQGTCTYTVAKTCGNDTGLPAFNVEATNENRGNTRVSFVGFVTVQVYNVTISVVRNEYGFVRVNNQRQRLPLALNNGQVRIYQSGLSLVVWTDMTLTVRYDWNSALVIHISSSYFGSVCGLCGNYNDDPADDLATPTGAQAANLTAFGKSWKVEDGDARCWHNCNGECKTCPLESQQKYGDAQACGIISKTGDGPFVQCLSLINPKTYLEYCVYDVCLYDGLKQILCQSIKNYADACQRNNTQIKEWRQLVGCSLQCPENSQYKLCGSACPKTCFDEAIPGTCSDSCVETCECKEGFVLDEGKCIPVASCGCIFEGKLYAANEKFWGDTKCESQCTCNPITKKVECKATRCKPSERCAVVNGIQNCYPLTYGTCIASGDPHYMTFDGVRYDFQGTCIYQFVGVCKKSEDLVDFLISVQNENRGNKAVSYTSAVQITVINLTIGFKRQYKGRVLLNGTLSNLPFTSDKGKLSIYMQGSKTILQTSFGLRVVYDWDSYLSVTIPGSYAGAVCGLCGNFNDDKANEFIMKNNQVAPNITSFAKSWNIQNTPRCAEDDKGVCPKLADYEARYRSSRKECGLLIDKAGPFRECHAKIDPEGAFKDCVFDACTYNGRLDVLCRVVSNYATHCQEAGVTIYPWRNATFCSLSCGKNSHYEVCASGCLPTCFTLSPPLGCNPVCSESCVCDDGFVLSGTECVPVSVCGCIYAEKYYKSGEVFFPNGTCNQQCICTPSGAVDCKNFSCGANEACNVVDGVQKCQPVGVGQCSASGDPHYMSFDGVAFDFQGTCTYTLSKTITTNAILVPFAINVKNEQWGNGPASVTKLVSIDVYGYSLILQFNQRGRVLVNGIFSNLPITLEDGKIKAYQHGMRVVINTDFGLKVRYDLVYNVIVNVPGNYKGQLGGLCGNYNGDRKDDFQLPDKKLAPDATTFGAAWKVQIPGVNCSDGCGGPGNPCPACDEKKKDVYKTDSFCGLLKKSGGPLSACYSAINPDVYFNNCIFDLCAFPGDGTINCQNIQSYVAACQAVGIDVQPWRTEAFCPLNCPLNSQYELCADVCSSICAGITDPAKCPTTCSEGCECDDGFFFDGQGCVPVDKCGCLLNGKYFQPLETILSPDCKLVCTCYPSGLIFCQENDCSADERCQIKEGIAKCINIDPCKSVKCRTKETCKVQDGNPVCVPSYNGTCWGWGDPHYQTFDGFKYDFQGTCTYILSKYIGDDAGLVPFMVEEKNDNRGSQAVSFVRIVSIYTYGYKISIQRNEFSKVRINDVTVNLPVALVEGRISIRLSGHNAVVRTDFGLQVTYDYNSHVVITLSSSYYGAVGGLCGNFNQNTKDELIGVDDKPVTSIIDWAKSWKVNDRDPFCFDICLGKCPKCDESKRNLYGGIRYCGLISKAVDGPFRECHAKVNPDTFFDNCIYDVCIYDGAKQFLCQALAAYDKTCRKQDVKVYDWRTPSGCVPSCPENSHYEFCGNACPATCVDRDAPDQCNEPCVETCQCNDGFVLSSDKCVPVSDCGCTYNGSYYLSNQEFWSDDNCQVLCKCDSITGLVICRLSSCKANEKCDIVNGQRKCQAISFSTCTGSGDPHYKTFDGKLFDFMGTCIYQLVGVTSKDPSLEKFTVKVQNNNRGNKAVSYTKVVTVEVYGLTLTLSMDYPRRILVNGVVGALPFYFQNNRIMAYISGTQGIIKTDFAVTVTYDWRSYVAVTIPGSYANGVAGLCGNNNKNPNDDFAMNNGKVANNSVQFGDSWKVGNVSGCTPECIKNCPQCPEAQKKQYTGDNYCGLIIKSTGPFRECLPVIDPGPYFNDCVYDACYYQGHPSSFCTSIGLYVMACQAVGVKLEEWRSPTFCGVSCPLNSHYEFCGNGCPAVCYGLASGADCQPSCKEGCYCDSGFILSGHNCVPVAQCGCVYKDRYYQKNDVFYLDDQCNGKCQCRDNGLVQCRDTACGADMECKVVNGIQGCQPKEFGTCVVSGDPHYTSFDGLTYDFQGACTYVLSMLVSDEFDELIQFSVLVENESYNTVAVTRKVTVSVFGFTVTLQRGMAWSVKVNEEDYRLPIILQDGDILINQEGNNIILQTSFGLKVLYDTAYYVELSVPSSYHNKLKGLCGNFNKDQRDEFQLPNGRITTNVDEFGAAWKFNVPCSKCGNGCGSLCPVCNETKIKPYTSNTSCGLIIDKDGPFKECHAKIQPQKYFKDCAYDSCVAQGKGDILCKSLQAYTAACQNIGVNIAQWRTDTFCRVNCPPNSHYEPCTRSCEKTCAVLTTPPTCTEQCFEGCECDDGYLFDGDQCVTVDKCGCVFNGRYLREGESFVTEDCGLQCTCQFTSVTCAEISCRPTERCGIKNGVQKCYMEQADCVVYSQTFSTFDGLAGGPIAPGGYELVSLCDRDSESWFRVIADLQSCESDAPLVVRIHIFLRGAFVTISKDKEVWVNGRLARFPVELYGLLSASIKEIHILVQIDTTLTLLLTESGDLKISIDDSFTKLVCGACGNFNGDTSDDLLDFQGKNATDVPTMIESWRARDLYTWDQGFQGFFN